MTIGGGKELEEKLVVCMLFTYLLQLLSDPYLLKLTLIYNLVKYLLICGFAKLWPKVWLWFFHFLRLWQVRPTSETIVNHMFTQWIHSYRDLPLMINQVSTLGIIRSPILYVGTILYVGSDALTILVNWMWFSGQMLQDGRCELNHLWGLLNSFGKRATLLMQLQKRQKMRSASSLHQD